MFLIYSRKLCFSILSFIRIENSFNNFLLLFFTHHFFLLNYEVMEKSLTIIGWGVLLDRNDFFYGLALLLKFPHIEHSTTCFVLPKPRVRTAAAKTFTDRRKKRRDRQVARSYNGENRYEYTHRKRRAEKNDRFFRISFGRRNRLRVTCRPAQLVSRADNRCVCKPLVSAHLTRLVRHCRV